MAGRCRDRRHTARSTQPAAATGHAAPNRRNAGFVDREDSPPHRRHTVDGLRPERRQTRVARPRPHQRAVNVVRRPFQEPRTLGGRTGAYRPSLCLGLLSRGLSAPPPPLKEGAGCGDHMQ
eukprot:361839-Chlamydomonas_euryale.AAC.6